MPLSAYFDESGTDRRSSVAVVAGLIAPPRQWERLTVEWQRILDDEELPDFHMKHYIACQGHFLDKEHWTKERKDRLMRRLVSLMVRRVTHRCWAALVMDDFRRIVKEDKTKLAPHAAVAMSCTSALLTLALERDLYIPYVFDQGVENERVFRGFEKLQQRKQFRIGLLSKGDRKKCLPLQAADLHAYEVRKYFADQAAGTPRLRKSFKELLRIPEAGVGGCLITGKKFKSLLGTVFLWRDDQEFSSPEMLPDELNSKRRVVLIPSTSDKEWSSVRYETG